MILGAVLAGGRSSRFGSDKALALLDGVSLIDRAIATLARQCRAVVVTGREEASVPCLPDWPAPGMGPLGGLAAALHFARERGFTQVLSLPVDGLVGDGLLGQLFPGPSYVASQPVIGLWPVDICRNLESLLQGTGRHSLRALAEACHARAVELRQPPANINTPQDLAAIEHQGRVTL